MKQRLARQIIACFIVSMGIVLCSCETDTWEGCGTITGFDTETDVVANDVYMHYVVYILDDQGERRKVYVTSSAWYSMQLGDYSCFEN